MMRQQTIDKINGDQLRAAAELIAAIKAGRDYESVHLYVNNCGGGDNPTEATTTIGYNAINNTIHAPYMTVDYIREAYDLQQTLNIARHNAVKLITQRCGGKIYGRNRRGQITEYTNSVTIHNVSDTWPPVADDKAVQK